MSGTKPRLTKARINFALSAQNRKSPPRARLTPAPAAAPQTEVITSLRIFFMVSASLIDAGNQRVQADLPAGLYLLIKEPDIPTGGKSLAVALAKRQP